MDKKERFHKLLRYIIYKNDVPITGALKAIAGQAGVSYSNLSTAARGSEKYLTDSLMLNINAAYDNPFRRSWLQNGDGEMLESKENATVENEAVTTIKMQQETISKLTESVANLSSLLKKQV